MGSKTLTFPKEGERSELDILKGQIDQAFQKAIRIKEKRVATTRRKNLSLVSLAGVLLIGALIGWKFLANRLRDVEGCPTETEVTFQSSSPNNILYPDLTGQHHVLLWQHGRIDDFQRAVPYLNRLIESSSRAQNGRPLLAYVWERVDTLSPVLEFYAQRYPTKAGWFPRLQNGTVDSVGVITQSEQFSQLIFDPDFKNAYEEYRDVSAYRKEQIFLEGSEEQINWPTLSEKDRARDRFLLDNRLLVFSERTPYRAWARIMFMLENLNRREDAWQYGGSALDRFLRHYRAARSFYFRGLIERDQAMNQNIAESIRFYTPLSLNTVYLVGYDHDPQIILRGFPNASSENIHRGGYDRQWKERFGEHYLNLGEGIPNLDREYEELFHGDFLPDERLCLALAVLENVFRAADADALDTEAIFEHVVQRMNQRNINPLDFLRQTMDTYAISLRTTPQEMREELNPRDHMLMNLHMTGLLTEDEWVEIHPRRESILGRSLGLNDTGETKILSAASLGSKDEALRLVSLLRGERRNVKGISSQLKSITSSLSEKEKIEVVSAALRLLPVLSGERVWERVTILHAWAVAVVHMLRELTSPVRSPEIRKKVILSALPLLPRVVEGERGPVLGEIKSMTPLLQTDSDRKEIAEALLDLYRQGMVSWPRHIPGVLDIWAKIVQEMQREDYKKTTVRAAIQLSGRIHVEVPHRRSIEISGALKEIVPAFRDETLNKELALAFLPILEETEETSRDQDEETVMLDALQQIMPLNDDSDLNKRFVRAWMRLSLKNADFDKLLIANSVKLLEKMISVLKDEEINQEVMRVLIRHLGHSFATDLQLFKDGSRKWINRIAKIAATSRTIDKEEIILDIVLLIPEWIARLKERLDEQAAIEEGDQDYLTYHYDIKRWKKRRLRFLFTQLSQTLGGTVIHPGNSIEKILQPSDLTEKGSSNVNAFVQFIVFTLRVPDLKIVEVTAEDVRKIAEYVTHPQAIVRKRAVTLLGALAPIDATHDAFDINNLRYLAKKMVPHSEEFEESEFWKTYGVVLKEINQWRKTGKREGSVLIQALASLLTQVAAAPAVAVMYVVAKLKKDREKRKLRRQEENAQILTEEKGRPRIVKLAEREGLFAIRGVAPILDDEAVKVLLDRKLTELEMRELLSRLRKVRKIAAHVGRDLSPTELIIAADSLWTSGREEIHLDDIDKELGMKVLAPPKEAYESLRVRMEGMSPNTDVPDSSVTEVGIDTEPDTRVPLEVLGADLEAKSRLDQESKKKGYGLETLGDHVMDAAIRLISLIGSDRFYSDERLARNIVQLVKKAAPAGKVPFRRRWQLIRESGILAPPFTSALELERHLGKAGNEVDLQSMIDNLKLVMETAAKVGKHLTEREIIDYAHMIQDYLYDDRVVKLKRLWAKRSLRERLEEAVSKTVTSVGQRFGFLGAEPAKSDAPVDAKTQPGTIKPSLEKARPYPALDGPLRTRVEEAFYPDWVDTESKEGDVRIWGDQIVGVKKSRGKYYLVYYFKDVDTEEGEYAFLNFEGELAEEELTLKGLIRDPAEIEALLPELRAQREESEESDDSAPAPVGRARRDGKAGKKKTPIKADRVSKKVEDLAEKAPESQRVVTLPDAESTDDVTGHETPDPESTNSAVEAPPDGSEADVARPKRNKLPERDVDRAEGASLGKGEPINRIKAFLDTGDLEILADQYRNSFDASWLVFEAADQIISPDFRDYFPTIYKKFLEYLKESAMRSGASSVQELLDALKEDSKSKMILDLFQTQNHAIVITGELAPESVLMRVAQGTSVIVHYENSVYLEELNRVARQMIEKGTLTEEKLNRHGYFANLTGLGLSVEDFLKKLFDGEAIEFQQGRRSLKWIKQMSGLRLTTPVVLLESDEKLLEKIMAEVIDFILPLEIRDIPFDSREGKAIYDLFRLMIAAKLADGPKAAEEQGIVFKPGDIYKPTEYLLKTLLENALVRHQIELLLGSMV